MAVRSGSDSGNGSGHGAGWEAPPNRRRFPNRHRARGGRGVLLGLLVLGCALISAPLAGWAVESPPLPGTKPHPSVVASIFDGPPNRPTAGPTAGTTDDTAARAVQPHDLTVQGRTMALPRPLGGAAPVMSRGDGGNLGITPGRSPGASSVSLAMRAIPTGLPRPPTLKPAPPRPDADALISAAGFRPDQVGFLVVDLDTNEILAEHNAHQAAFLPASVLKVPTTVAALQVLGPDHRFATDLRFEGIRGAEGTWRGTLTLVGGGDPVLDSEALQDLVSQLAQAGLRRLDGAFVYDDSLLARSPSIDPDQPAEFSYNPGVSALSLDFNRVRIQWRGAAVSLAEAHGTPPVAPVLVDRAHAGSGGWSRGGPWFRHETLAGTLGAGSSGPAPRTASGDTAVERWHLSPLMGDQGARWVPVQQPAPFTASVFRALAGKAGIVLPPAQPIAALASGSGAPRGDRVAHHDSPPLSAIVRLGLKYSNNLVAELAGLATSRALTGQALDLPASAAVVQHWLTAAMPWVDWAGFVMANHSGLSSASRASPEQIVSILRFALEHPAGGRLGYDTLLPQRAYGAPEARVQPVAASVRAGGISPDVRAKTGTMYHGRGLAGLVRGSRGHRLVFALFVSDLAARKAFDDGYLHYSGSAVARAKTSLRHARDLEQALLLSWIVAH